MSIFLYKLSRLAFRRRWAMVGFWVVLLVAGGVGAATLSGPTVNTLSIPGTESQAAQDLLAERFPESSTGGASARIVFESPAGTTLADPAIRQSVSELVSALGKDPEVAAVSDPYASGGVSPTGTIGYMQVSYTADSMDLPDSSKELLESAVHDAADSGLAVDVAGNVLMESSAESMGEVIGVAIAAVVLTVTFGSLVAAGLPLISALIGIGIAICTITIATGFIELGSSTTVLAMMLGLAVAIDYSLFIVSRYRSELRDGHDPEIAAGRAAGTAGSAVVFAGLTVLIALAGLFVVNIPFLTSMGLAAAFAVAVAVVISLTLLPATLGFAGSRVLSRSDRRLLASGGQLTHRKTKEGAGSRWAKFVIRRRVPVLLASVLGLGLLAIPTFGINLSLASPPVPDTTAARATDRLSEGFGAGFSGPLMVVVDVADATNPAAALSGAQEKLGALPDIAAVTPPALNQAGDTAVITVVPSSGPETEATKALVADIREVAGSLTDETGATMSVTGQTALTIDVSDRLADALVPYLALVVGLAFILLMLVFRSILVPLKATLGFLLSIGATFGVLVAIFQWGWFAGILGIEGQTGSVVAMLPIFMIGIVFGLAMDYQVFLVTRMREAFVHGDGPDEAVVKGFDQGARVVTAAALIMIAVFAGFIFGGDAFIMQIGLGLSFAVLFDAFVIRMTVVPAVMSLLGSKAWWFPSWLDRLVPNVDVEGEQLTALLADSKESGEPTSDKLSV
ncbi:MAG: MMPL family transporter [Rhodococcus sp. (in: high G+C Gram-positive bacteria)]|uniref:MMPL family transporter n=1 Tax=Rhodococcus sp. TaxID=1831 RepID=UPI002AD89FD8|nr:MMPL family transporter [Rhodococcus sp. (in: high G+C Gram-positive bacteria)]